MNEVKTDIPSINNLATTTALTVVENKILVIKMKIKIKIMLVI